MRPTPLGSKFPPVPSRPGPLLSWFQGRLEPGPLGSRVPSPQSFKGLEVTRCQAVKRSSSLGARVSREQVFKARMIAWLLYDLDTKGPRSLDAQVSRRRPPLVSWSPAGRG